MRTQKYRFDRDIELAIYDWVSKESGITTIWDKPDQPRPKLPYITLNIISGPNKIGTDEIKYEENKFKINGRRFFTLSIQAFGERALETMSNLQSSIEKPTVREKLRSAGLAIWNEPNVLDLTTLLETDFEQRSSMDVMFGITRQIIDEELTYIETTDVAATFF